MSTSQTLEDSLALVRDYSGTLVIRYMYCTDVSVIINVPITFTFLDLL